MSEFRNKISSKELQEIIRLQLDTMSKYPRASRKLPPTMVWGAPGIGKSTIIRQISEDLGIGFIDVRLAQREPVDIRGLPVPSEDGVKWLVSSEWPRDPSSRGIILFDEITSADRSLQVAAYEFILDRRLGDLYTVPDGWYIVAAGNRVEDRAVAMTMSSALANRFLHVELKEDSEEWGKWAVSNGIHPAVCSFIRFRPELLFKTDSEDLERGWPTPRSWERVSVMLKLAEQTGMRKSLAQKLVYGLVGNGAGSEFMSFYGNSDIIEDVLEVLKDPSKDIIIPDSPDRKYALVSAMVYYLWKAEDENDLNTRLTGFFKICMKLSNDFSAMAISDAMASEGRLSKKVSADKASRILSHPLYKEWAKSHGKVLKKYL